MIATKSPHFRIVGLATLGVVAAVIAVHAGSHGEPHWFTAYVPLEILPRWMVISVIIFLAAVVSSTVGFAFRHRRGDDLALCVEWR